MAAPADVRPSATVREPDVPVAARLKPGAPAEILLTGRVYTLHVNMPNLSSASGSWVLNFAEMNQDDPYAPPSIHTGELTAPQALRKVDPRYPPALAEMKIQGEVVLYAIIRKDGSVDSIQLVHKLDPVLDQNAMQALAHWKFRPAERAGSPVPVEAVIHIPFHFFVPEQ
jgi:TonB family protein